MVFSQYFYVPVSVTVPPVFHIYSPVVHGTNNGPISDHSSTQRKGHPTKMCQRNEYLYMITAYFFATGELLVSL